MDLDNKNLFPEINPNIDELVEKEDMIASDEVIKDDDMDYSTPKTNHNDIFIGSNQKRNVKLKVKEPTDTITQSDIEPKPKKDRYAHLAKARQKGIETRSRKAEEKKRLKELEKAKKAEERQARKQATAERNRENARKRYYKQKESKQNVARKIVEDTKPPPMNSIKARPTPNNNMDFNTFAKYMMKYETMKDAYNKHKNKTKAIPIPKKKPEPKKEEYHPKHYPLSMYAPTNRYKEFTGF